MAAIARKQAGFPSPTFLITRSILDTKVSKIDLVIKKVGDGKPTFLHHLHLSYTGMTPVLKS